jgi:hypothetical protein
MKAYQVRFHILRIVTMFVVQHFKSPSSNEMMTFYHLKFLFQALQMS